MLWVMHSALLLTPSNEIKTGGNLDVPNESDALCVNTASPVTGRRNVFLERPERWFLHVNQNKDYGHNYCTQKKAFLPH